MPPKPSITLTVAELRIMKVLWRRGECSVADVVAGIDEELAYTSVLTTVRILESKGYVTHRQQGRAFLYTPSIQEQEASRSELRHILHRFFGNSREQLVLSLLEDRDTTPEEIGRLKALIANAGLDSEELHGTTTSSKGTKR